MFTQLNQYHVVLEVKPDFHRTPLDLSDLFIRTGATLVQRFGGVVGGRHGHGGHQRTHQFRHRVTGQLEFHRIEQRQSARRPSPQPPHFPTAARCRSAPSAPSRPHRAITINHQGQFPVVTLSFNLAPNASLGDAVEAVNKAKDESACRPAFRPRFRAPRRRFRLRWPTSRC